MKRTQARPMLDADDLALRWGCTRRKVLDMARAREIPSYKLGKLVRFSPDDIEAYEAENRKDRILR